MKYLRKYKFLLALLPMVGFTIGISIIGPDTITQTIGIDNSYLFMFIVAFIGGISLFAGVPYPLILITLALGGSNLVYLSIVTTLGVMLGDSSSYYLGGRVKKTFEGNTKKVFDKILSIYDIYPTYIMGFFFFYGVLSPFPNDLITLSAGMKKYNFRKTMLPLTGGNFVFCLMLTNFAEYFVVYF